jgi:hypothetical protein
MHIVVAKESKDTLQKLNKYVSDPGNLKPKMDGKVTVLTLQYILSTCLLIWCFCAVQYIYIAHVYLSVARTKHHIMAFSQSRLYCH